MTGSHPPNDKFASGMNTSASNTSDKLVEQGQFKLIKKQNKTNNYFK